MATVRYQVDGVPAHWAAAFFPTPGLSPAGATSVSRFTQGAPGTMRVHSPRPAWSGRLSSSPDWHPPSEVAPDYICPQLYVNDIRELGPIVQYMPSRYAAVPPPVGQIGDRSALGPAPVAMRGRKVGGRRSMKWPRTIVRWPDLLRSS